MTSTKPVIRRLAAILAPVALLVALSSWAFASPLGASPDDDYHLPSIWCGQGIREGICEEGNAADERKVPEALFVSSACFAFNSSASASCTEPARLVLKSTSRGNFVGDYPPVFYSVMSVFVSDNIEASVIAMRIFNAVLFVGFTSALFFLLPPRRRGVLVWGGLAAIVPLGMFLIPSVNPSSWAVLSAFTLWHALMGWFESTSRARSIAFALIASLATLMGSGARSDAAVYCGIAIVVVTILTVRKNRTYLKRAILPALLVLLAIFFFFVSGQSSVVEVDGDSGITSFTEIVRLAVANLVLLPQLWTGALGSWGLGWLDTTMPGIVWIAVVCVYFVFVFTGLVGITRRKALALGLTFVALVLIPMYVLVNDGVMVGSDVQPRYIYPLIIMLVGIALYRLEGGLTFTRLQFVVVGVLLGVANSIALHVNMRRYVTGLDDNGVDLDSGIEWWWNIAFGPMWVWAIGTISFAALLVIAVRHFSRERLPLERSGPALE